MSDKMFFSRDSKVFIDVGTTRYEIPVLDGFSFSQAQNASEITINEMSDSDGVSRRGRQMFNDSFAPAEWSFSTYARPFKSDGSDYTLNQHHAVEEILWALMVGKADSTTVSGVVSALTAAPTTGGGATYVAGRTAGLSTVDLATDSDGDGTGAVARLTVATNNSLTAAIVSGKGGKGYEATDNLSITNTEIKNAFGLSAAPSANLVLDIDTVTNSAQALEGITPGGSELAIDFGESNKSTLGTATIFFELGGVGSDTKIYKIENCCLNEASLDFDIEGIAQINWSGMGTKITEVASKPAIATTIDESVTSTSNFIRNRLTALDINEVSGSTYQVVLTGGNVTISNNLSFLTPETLGVVNHPLGHVTGTRNIGGSFTCYLNSKDHSSAGLFKTLADKTTQIQNEFDLTFKIGGTVASTPRVELHLDHCHLEVPTHSIEDVISLETTFHALPSSLAGTDELTIKYKGA